MLKATELMFDIDSHGMNELAAYIYSEKKNYSRRA